MGEYETFVTSTEANLRRLYQIIAFDYHEIFYIHFKSTFRLCLKFGEMLQDG